MSRHQPAQKPGKSEQEVETPDEFIRAVEARFGPLTIDLAASPANAKAKKFFTLEDNALGQAWPGRADLCWLNPPFGEIGRWAEKVVEEATGPNGSRIVMLTPAGVSTRWFAEHVWPNALVLAINRMRFVGHAQDFPKDLICSVFGIGVRRVFDTWRWR